MKTNETVMYSEALLLINARSSKSGTIIAGSHVLKSSIASDVVLGMSKFIIFIATDCIANNQKD